MNAVEKEVVALVEKELVSANEKFPLFHSPHEGYAVIKEELEEVKDADGYLETAVVQLWNCVKTNKDGKLIEYAVARIYSSAIDLAVEAIQVAAMAAKYEQSLLKGEADDRASNRGTEDTGHHTSRCSRS